MSRVFQIPEASFFRDEGTQVVVSREPLQASMGPHSHEFIEVVIVLSGSGVHVTDGAVQQLRAGDVLVIHSSRIHAYQDTRSLNLVNILIREDLFRETEKELGTLSGYHALFTLEPVRWRQRKFTSHLRLAPDDLKLAVSWIDAMEEETAKKSEGGPFLARSWTILLIGLLARRYGKSSAHTPRLEMRLGRVLSRIEQDVAEKFTMAKLARQAAMSQRTFQRRFREATGHSPIDYIIRARVRRATELLAAPAPRRSITEIAFRCGFQDSNYFTRQFRRMVGTSPRHYRNQG
jgi:AraC-like DNA-binding protein/mannose-6-phosphate isomerase-like protein (cupin superfamily)